MERVSHPISLEVDENSSGDLGDEDEQQAGEVLQGIKGNVRITTFMIKTQSTLKEINNLLSQIRFHCF